MKTIDCSPTPVKSSEMDWLDRLRGTIQHGFNWFAELEAYDQAADALARYLDHRFVLLRNVLLPGLELAIPFILVGPSGVHVLTPAAEKGIFQARGDAWLEADASQEFHPVKPNLLTRASLMAEAVRIYLEREGMPFPKVEPVLLCVDPGVHIESLRPSVRIVMSDAFDRFAASLMGIQVALGPETAEKLIGLLTKAGKTHVVEPEPKPMSLAEVEGIAGPDEEQAAPKPPPRLPINLNIQAPDFARRLNLTTRQLTILGIIAGLEILVVIAFLIFVLVAS